MKGSKLKISLTIIIILILTLFIHIVNYSSFKENVLYPQSKLKSFTQVQKQNQPKIISREKALKIANNFLLDGLNLENEIELKSIFLENSLDNTFEWNINIINKDTFEVYDLYIDSHTGEILIFQTGSNHDLDKSKSYTLTEYDLEKIRTKFLKYVNIDINNYELKNDECSIYNKRYKEYKYYSDNDDSILFISIDMKTKQIHEYRIFKASLIGVEDNENFIS